MIEIYSVKMKYLCILIVPAVRMYVRTSLRDVGFIIDIRCMSGGWTQHPGGMSLLS